MTRIILDEQPETAIISVIAAIRDIHRLDSNATEVAAFDIDSGVCLLCVNIKSFKAVDGRYKEKWNAFVENK